MAAMESTAGRLVSMPQSAAETKVGADFADLCASTTAPRLTSLSSAQGKRSQSRYGSSQKGCHHMISDTYKRRRSSGCGHTVRRHGPRAWIGIHWALRICMLGLSLFALAGCGSGATASVASGLSQTASSRTQGTAASTTTSTPTATQAKTETEPSQNQTVTASAQTKSATTATAAKTPTTTSTTPTQTVTQS